MLNNDRQRIVGTASGFADRVMDTFSSVAASEGIRQQL